MTSGAVAIATRLVTVSMQLAVVAVHSVVVSGDLAPSTGDGVAVPLYSASFTLYYVVASSLEATRADDGVHVSLY